MNKIGKNAEFAPFGDAHSIPTKSTLPKRGENLIGPTFSIAKLISKLTKKFTPKKRTMGFVSPRKGKKNVNRNHASTGEFSDAPCTDITITRDKINRCTISTKKFTKKRGPQSESIQGSKRCRLDPPLLRRIPHLGTKLFP